MLSAGKGKGVGLEEATGDSFLGGCLLVFSLSEYKVRSSTESEGVDVRRGDVTWWPRVEGLS